MTVLQKSNYNQFLDEYGITSVCCESANGIYAIMQKKEKNTVIFSECIETDGKIEVMPEEIEASDELIRRIEVTDASWVIKNVFGDDGIKRILYTYDDPRQIVGLSKII